MTKKITQTDLFLESILHKHTIIEVKGVDKVKNEIAPYRTKRAKVYVADSFLKNKHNKETLKKEGWKLSKKHTINKWKVTKPKKESDYLIKFIPGS